MAKSTVHFVLAGKSDYRDLAPIFGEMLKSALIIADQMLEEEEFTMIEQLNLDDLEQNRKPEGYIRKARIRMIFPMDRKEFYFQSYNNKIVDLNKIRESTAAILDGAKINYSVSEDDDISFDINPKKK